MKSLLYAGAATIVGVAVAAGAANAEAPVARSNPGSIEVEVAPGFLFTGAQSDNSAQLASPFGTVTTRNDQITVTDTTHNPIIGAPSNAVAASASAPSVTHAAPVAPVAGGDPLGDLSQAWQQASPYTSLAVAVGTTAGGLTGAAIGCPLGAVTLGSMVTVASAATLTVPGMLAGCIAGAGAGAGAGGMIGAAAVGLPVGAAVTIQKYNQIQAERAASRSSASTEPR